MHKPTLADTIVFALTDEIVGGHLRPGDVLDEATLGQRFGASRTPVREALRQLAAGGLIELRTHRAPIVALIDERGLADMFDVMAELEALCAARACISMSTDQRVAFEQQHLTMAAAMKSGDTAAYRAGNVEFHQMIYDGAANGYLRDLAHATRIRLAPYRAAQLEAPERLARSYAEHGTIVAAILRGDHQVVADLMRQHLALTREALEERRNQPAAQ
jgi:DNA-binding GntR family transcriptional regulator